MANVIPLKPAPVAAQATMPKALDLGLGDYKQIKARTVLLYGDSGLGKSTNARFFAQWMYEKTGLKVRLIAFEDSSKMIFQPLIDLGIVEAVFLTKVTAPLVVMRRLSRGEWPILSGTGSVKSWTALKPGEVSAYIIEGLTSGSEAELEQLREEHRMLREQAKDAFEVGGEKFAPSSQTAFGFVQQEMLQALKGFGMLPVERVLWTAHECTGADEDTKEPIRGPGLVGKAATDKVRKYCGMLLHMDGVVQKDKTLKPRIFYRKHPDPKFTHISYPAKTTVPVEKLSDLEKACPGGYFDPGTEYGTGLGKFLATVDSLVSEFTNTDLSRWKEKVDQQLKHGTN